MPNCHVTGCRHLETRCKDCGRLVADRILTDNHHALPDHWKWRKCAEELPKVYEIVWIYWRDDEVLLGCHCADSEPSQGWYSLEDEKCRWTHWWRYYAPGCAEKPKPPQE